MKISKIKIICLLTIVNIIFILFYFSYHLLPCLFSFCMSILAYISRIFQITILPPPQRTELMLFRVLNSFNVLSLCARWSAVPVGVERAVSAAAFLLGLLFFPTPQRHLFVSSVLHKNTHAVFWCVSGTALSLFLHPHSTANHSSHSQPVLKVPYQ